MTMPSKITHVFFDVHDVLVDREPLKLYYAETLGQIMAARYGKTPDDWARAYHRVVQDWFSYYADLNLSGDEGLDEPVHRDEPGVVEAGVPHHPQEGVRAAGAAARLDDDRLEGDVELDPVDAAMLARLGQTVADL